MSQNLTRAAAPPALATKARRGRPRTKPQQLTGNEPQGQTFSETHSTVASISIGGQTPSTLFNPHNRSKNPAPKRRPRRKSKGTHGEDDDDDDDADADVVARSRSQSLHGADGDSTAANGRANPAGVDPLALLRKKRRRTRNEYEDEDGDEDEEDDDFEEVDEEDDDDDDDDDDTILAVEEEDDEDGEEGVFEEVSAANDDGDDLDAGQQMRRAKKARRVGDDEDETDASDTDEGRANPRGNERASARKLRPRRGVQGARVGHRSVISTETEGDSRDEASQLSGHESVHDKVLQQQRGKVRKGAAHGGSKGSASRGRRRHAVDGDLVGTDLFYDDDEEDDDEEDDEDDLRSNRSKQTSAKNDAAMLGYPMDQSLGSIAGDADDGRVGDHVIQHGSGTARRNEDEDDEDGAHNAHTPQAMKSIITPQRARTTPLGKQGFDALEEEYDDVDPAGGLDGADDALGRKGKDSHRNLDLGSDAAVNKVGSNVDTSLDSLQASVLITSTDQGGLNNSMDVANMVDKSIDGGSLAGDVSGVLDASSASLNITVNVSIEEDINKNATPDEIRFKKARKALLLSSLPSVLPCRERERMAIESFLRSAVDEGAEGRCLYISGVPGTGKTATVLEVVRSLQRDQSLPDFRLLEMNGMKLVEPTHAYALLWNLISKRKATPLQAQQYLDRYFSGSNETRPICVVVIDEMDYLVTRNQSVLYNLFDWPTRANSGIITIGIANTMDLPERLMPRIASRIGKHRLTFHPYDRRQLETIIQSRLSGIDVFDQAAIGLCAGKVAAMTGDARRALEFCRKAIEIAEFNKSSVVTMQHVDACLRATLQSPVLLCIRGLSKYEKLFLCSVILELKRSGTTYVSFRRVANRLQTICANNSVYPINTSEVSSVCARLASSSVLTTDSGEADLYQKIRLNPDPADASTVLREEEPFDFILGQERSM